LVLGDAILGELAAAAGARHTPVFARREQSHSAVSVAVPTSFAACTTTRTACTGCTARTAADTANASASKRFALGQVRVHFCVRHLHFASHTRDEH
jgi:hypothetical protein